MTSAFHPPLARARSASPRLRNPEQTPHRDKDRWKYGVRHYDIVYIKQLKHYFERFTTSCHEDRYTLSLSPFHHLTLRRVHNHQTPWQVTIGRDQGTGPDPPDPQCLQDQAGSSSLCQRDTECHLDYKSHDYEPANKNPHSSIVQVAKTDNFAVQTNSTVAKTADKDNHSVQTKLTITEIGKINVGALQRLASKRRHGNSNNRSVRSVKESNLEPRRRSPKTINQLIDDRKQNDCANSSKYLTFNEYSNTPMNDTNTKSSNLKGDIPLNFQHLNDSDITELKTSNGPNSTGGHIKNGPSTNMGIRNNKPNTKQNFSNGNSVNSVLYRSFAPHTNPNIDIVTRTGSVEVLVTNPEENDKIKTEILNFSDKNVHVDQPDSIEVLVTESNENNKFKTEILRYSDKNFETLPCTSFDNDKIMVGSSLIEADKRFPIIKSCKENIKEWLAKQPLYPAADPIEVQVKENAINKLVESICNLIDEVDQNDYQTYAQRQINKFMEILNIWLPENITKYKKGARQELFHKFIEIYNRYSKRNKIENVFVFKTASSNPFQNYDCDYADRKRVVTEMLGQRIMSNLDKPDLEMAKSALKADIINILEELTLGGCPLENTRHLADYLSKRLLADHFKEICSTPVAYIKNTSSIIQSKSTKLKQSSNLHDFLSDISLYKTRGIRDLNNNKHKEYRKRSDKPSHPRIKLKHSDTERSLNVQEYTLFLLCTHVIRSWFEKWSAKIQGCDDVIKKKMMIFDLADAIINESKTKKDAGTSFEFLIEKWLKRFNVNIEYHKENVLRDMVNHLNEIFHVHNFTPETSSYNPKSFVQYDLNLKCKSIETLKKEITRWMQRQPSYVFKINDQLTQKDIVDQLAKNIHNVYATNYNYADVIKEVTKWLRKVVHVEFSKNNHKLAKSLTINSMLVPSDSIFVATAVSQSNSNKPSTGKAANKDQNTKNVRKTYDSLESTMIALISTYIKQTLDVEHPTTRRALAQILKNELQKVCPLTRKKIYDNLTENHEEFLLEKLNVELSYAIDISEWLNNTLIEGSFNVLGNRNRVDFVLDLAKALTEAEEERIYSAQSFDINKCLRGIICKSTHLLPIIPDQKQNSGLMIDQLVDKVAKHRPIVEHILRNKQPSKPPNIIDFIENYVQVKSRDYADDHLLFEIWSTRVMKEIMKIIYTSPEDLSQSRGYSNLANMPKSNNEKVKLFNLRLAYAKEISDWLQNLQLTHANEVDRVTLVVDLAEIFTEIEAKNKSDSNDKQTIVKLQGNIAEWISNLPLDASKTDKRVTIQQLFNRIDLVNQRNGDEHRQCSVSTFRKPGLRSSNRHTFSMDVPKQQNSQSSKSQSSPEFKYEYSSFNRPTPHPSDRNNRTDNDRAVYLGESNNTRFANNQRKPLTESSGYVLLNDIETLCNEIPFPSTTVQDRGKAKELKDDLVTSILRKFDEVNSDSKLCNNEDIFEYVLNIEFNKILTSVLPQNLQFNRDQLKYKMVKECSFIKRVQDKQKEVIEYKKNLQNVVAAVIGKHVKESTSSKILLEQVQNYVVDEFLEYQFSKNCEPKKAIHKEAIQNILKNYYNSVNNKHADSSLKCNQLICELSKVPPPNEGFLSNEISQIRMRKKVNDYFMKFVKSPSSDKQPDISRTMVKLAKMLCAIEKAGYCPQTEEIMKNEVLKALNQLNIKEEPELIATGFINELKCSETERKVCPQSTRLYRSRTIGYLTVPGAIPSPYLADSRTARPDHANAVTPESGLGTGSQITPTNAECGCEEGCSSNVNSSLYQGGGPRSLQNISENSGFNPVFNSTAQPVDGRRVESRPEFTPGSLPDSSLDSTGTGHSRQGWQYASGYGPGGSRTPGSLPHSTINSSGVGCSICPGQTGSPGSLPDTTLDSTGIGHSRRGRQYASGNGPDGSETPGSLLHSTMNSSRLASISPDSMGPPGSLPDTTLNSTGFGHSGQGWQYASGYGPDGIQSPGSLPNSTVNRSGGSMQSYSIGQQTPFHYESHYGPDGSRTVGSLLDSTMDQSMQVQPFAYTSGYGPGNNSVGSLPDSTFHLPSRIQQAHAERQANYIQRPDLQNNETMPSYNLNVGTPVQANDPNIYHGAHRPSVDFSDSIPNYSGYHPPLSSTLKPSGQYSQEYSQNLTRSLPTQNISDVNNGTLPSYQPYHSPPNADMSSILGNTQYGPINPQSFSPDISMETEGSVPAPAYNSTIRYGGFRSPRSVADTTQDFTGYVNASNHDIPPLSSTFYPPGQAPYEQVQSRNSPTQGSTWLEDSSVQQGSHRPAREIPDSYLNYSGFDPSFSSSYYPPHESHQERGSPTQNISGVNMRTLPSYQPYPQSPPNADMSSIHENTQYGPINPRKFSTDYSSTDTDGSMPAPAYNSTIRYGGFRSPRSVADSTQDFTGYVNATNHDIPPLSSTFYPPGQAPYEQAHSRSSPTQGSTWLEDSSVQQGSHRPAREIPDSYLNYSGFDPSFSSSYYPPHESHQERGSPTQNISGVNMRTLPSYQPYPQSPPNADMSSIHENTQYGPINPRKFSTDYSSTDTDGSMPAPAYNSTIRYGGFRSPRSVADTTQDFTGYVNATNHDIPPLSSTFYPPGQAPYEQAHSRSSPTQGSTWLEDSSVQQGSHRPAREIPDSYLNYSGFNPSFGSSYYPPHESHQTSGSRGTRNQTQGSLQPMTTPHFNDAPPNYIHTSNPMQQNLDASVTPSFSGPVAIRDSRRAATNQSRSEDDINRRLDRSRSGVDIPYHQSQAGGFSPPGWRYGCPHRNRNDGQNGPMTCNENNDARMVGRIRCPYHERNERRCKPWCF